VGASSENSATTGIDGDPLSVGQVDSGAVYVFQRDGAQWTQQAYVKASDTFAVDRFGTSLAVGAPQEGSDATGVGGKQTDQSAQFAGAVYVFTRNGAQQWSQRTYVKAPNTGTRDSFGFSVGLSADGTTLAVGAMLEDSIATGVDGDQSENNAPDAGAVYLY
jgi:FG-GAP repeat protein